MSRVEPVVFPAGRVLSAAQIEEFVVRGWTKLPAAFSPEQAAPCRDFLWEKIEARGVLRDDRSTWTKPMVFIAENYEGPPFDACATARLEDAVTDLIGDGRWQAQGTKGLWGWWPVNFAVGAKVAWDVPADHWHFDSPDEARYVESGDQGLLLICLFSALSPGGGGTLIAEGSHRLVTRYLQAHPGTTKMPAIKGTIESHPWLRELCGLDLPADESAMPPPTDWEGAVTMPDAVEGWGGPPMTARMRRFMEEPWVDPEDGQVCRVVEITGEPGDVFLGHPMLFHAPTSNHSGRPRMMCNRKTTLHADLVLDRPDGGYSPLEESVRRALR